MKRCISTMLVAMVLVPSIASGTPAVSSEKAELMGRVEDFFMHNFKDITWRKSLEWGEVKANADGSRSIRYRFKAKIWDKETIEGNQTFTFGPDGQFVQYKDVEGFPKTMEQGPPHDESKVGVIKLVEDFFANNYRDITKRRTIEWGSLTRDDAGNSTIRYKYEATIRGKDTKIMNQVFCFDAQGTFVSVTDAGDGTD